MDTLRKSLNNNDAINYMKNSLSYLNFICLVYINILSKKFADKL